MIQTIIYRIFLLAIVTGTGCSYIADYTEGAITNRASFSISAYYDSVNSRVVVLWDANPDNDSFAGYEIYMTEEADNEYADMIVVGACYDISNSLYFIQDSGLDSPSSSVFYHLSGNLPLPGIYFYRVGVIEWDEQDYDGDGEDDKAPDTPSKLLYESNTNIAHISGSAMVIIE